jgi:hypothetical protein
MLKTSAETLANYRFIDADELSEFVDKHPVSVERSPKRGEKFISTLYPLQIHEALSDFTDNAVRLIVNPTEAAVRIGPGRALIPF